MNLMMVLIFGTKVPELTVSVIKNNFCHVFKNTSVRENRCVYNTPDESLKIKTKRVRVVCTNRIISLSYFFDHSCKNGHTLVCENRCMF